MSKLLYRIAMSRSKGYFTQKYTRDFWRQFRAGSDACLNELLPQIPDIGKSVFAFNYRFAPAYLAWYKTLMRLGVLPQEAGRDLWAINERMAGLVPRFVMKAIGQKYVSGFREQVIRHERRQRTG